MPEAELKNASFIIKFISTDYCVNFLLFWKPDS